MRIPQDIHKKMRNHTKKPKRKSSNNLQKTLYYFKTTKLSYEVVLIKACYTELPKKNLPNEQ